MATQTVTKEFDSALEKAISRSIRESIHSEFMKIRTFGIHGVSSKEHKNVERLYKKPSTKKEFLSLAGTLASRIKLSDRKLRNARKAFHSQWHARP